MKQLLIILSGICLLFSCAETEYLPIPFIKLLDRTKLVFNAPDGYKQIATAQNKQINWELAYMHPHKKFEIRYAIRPMDNMLKEYQENQSVQDSSNINIHPNKLYLPSFKATLHNISGGEIPNYTIFSQKTAKSEFNADWGATATVNVGKEFGQDYKYCFTICIHKDNIGDAYIFCLADDITLLSNEMKPIIHNLKFITNAN